MYDQYLHDPETWNLYNYVTNNPVTHTDPDGRATEEKKEPTADKDGSGEGKGPVPEKPETPKPDPKKPDGNKKPEGRPLTPSEAEYVKQKYGSDADTSKSYAANGKVYVYLTSAQKKEKGDDVSKVAFLGSIGNAATDLIKTAKPVANGSKALYRFTPANS